MFAKIVDQSKIAPVFQINVDLFNLISCIISTIDRGDHKFFVEFQTMYKKRIDVEL